VPISVTVGPSTYPWTRADNGEPLELELRLARRDDLARLRREWLPALTKANRPEKDWPWEEQIRLGEEEDGHACFVVTSEGSVDAFLSLSVTPDVVSRYDPKGSPLVYVEYVAAAPKHTLAAEGSRTLKGLGTFLIEVSVAISADLGFDGRLALHSLPESERFYRKLNFCTSGVRENADGESLLYFEAGAATAASLLQEGR
jgi:hypothetical protein